MIKDLFDDPSLRYEPTPSTLTQSQISASLPFEFEGQDDFQKFYCQSNGVVFSSGAFIRRQAFYEVSDDDYNLLDVGCLLKFSDAVGGDWAAYRRDQRTTALADTHFPFALDSSGNLFLLTFQSGIVKYSPHETPEHAADAAPSFLTFCQALRASID